MADNAIDKLIEETRAAYAEADRINAQIRALDEQRHSAQEQFADAKRRCKLLDLTMRKHIHENMPVVQAKMVAHEEIGSDKSSFRQNWASAAGSVSSAAHSAAGAGSVAQSHGHLASLGNWILNRQNGHLRGSI